MTVRRTICGANFLTTLLMILVRRDGIFGWGWIHGADGDGDALLRARLHHRGRHQQRSWRRSFLLFPAVSVDADTLDDLRREQRSVGQRLCPAPAASPSTTTPTRRWTRTTHTSSPAGPPAPGTPHPPTGPASPVSLSSPTRHGISKREARNAMNQTVVVSEAGAGRSRDVTPLKPFFSWLISSLSSLERPFISGDFSVEAAAATRAFRSTCQRHFPN